jgi:UDP-N-acetylmuramate--alanine ligase
MDAEKISEAVTAFKGIKRRFEIVHDGKQTLIDDYAHHPEELRNAVKTAKILFPERKVLGIFQAHLYSRTKDFYKEFAEVLSELDEIWLMEIYPAREEPIEGVSAEMIFNLIKKDNKKIVHGSALINELRKRKDLDVLMTIGASDIDKYHEEIVKILK